MALPATVGSGLSWSDHLSGRPGPFQPHPSLTDHTASSGTTQLHVGALAANARRGQTFTPASSGTVSQVVLYPIKFGTSARTYTVEIFATSGGLPTGSALASGTFAHAAINGATTLPFAVRLSAGVALTSGTQYALVVRDTANTLDGTNYVSLQHQTTGSYADGTALNYDNGTSTWSTTSGDFLFDIETDSPNLYVVARDNANSHIEVWKSTDSGQTWAEANAANHKTGIASANFRSFDSVLVGTVITVAYITAANQVFFADFDTATDTWGTPVGTVISPSNVVDNTGAAPIFVARRSNGDTIIATAGNYTNMATYRQPYYHRYVGGVWTANTAVGAGAQVFTELRPILTDGSIVLFPYTDVTTDNYSQRALSSANALGTASTSAGLNATTTYGWGAGVYDGAEFNVPGMVTTAASFSNRRTTVSGSTISVAGTNTISASTVSNPEPLTHALALASVSDTIHAFWINDNQTEIDRDDDAGTGTWGTDTVWKPGAYSVTDTLVSITTQPIQGATGATEAAAQSFTPASAVDVSSVSLNLFKAGTPTDDLVIEIRSGSQTGTVLGSTTLAASGVASPAWNAATFASPVSLSAGTRYWLVLTRSGARDTTNYIGVRANTSASVVAGETLSTRASGVWTDNASGFDLLATIPGLLTSIAAQPVVIGGSSVGILYLEAGAIIYDSYPQSTLTPPGTNISVDSAVATGAGVAPSLVTAFSVPAATATAAGSAPTVITAESPPAATASAAGQSPGYATRIPVSAATATGQGQTVAVAEQTTVPVASAVATGIAGAPVVVTAFSAPSATATGVASAPTMVLTQAPPAAAATGAASPPTLALQVASAAATAAGSAPTVSVAVPTGSAAASAQSFAPTLGTSMPAAAAAASATGAAPSLATSLIADTASAAALATAPTLAVAFSVPAATATATAHDPDIPAIGVVSFSVPSASAAAQGYTPTLSMAAAIPSAVANAAGSSPTTATLVPASSASAAAVASAPTLLTQFTVPVATAAASGYAPDIPPPGTVIDVDSAIAVAAGTDPTVALSLPVLAGTATAQGHAVTITTATVILVDSAIANAAGSAPGLLVAFTPPSATAIGTAYPYEEEEPLEPGVYGVARRVVLGGGGITRGVQLGKPASGVRIGVARGGFGTVGFAQPQED